MDNGIAIIIASALPTLMTLISGYLTRRQATRVQESSAKLLVATNNRMESIHHEMNSMKDALVLAEKEASERKGEKAGIAIGEAQAAARRE